MTAPVDVRAMLAQIEREEALAEARELHKAQRRLSNLAAAYERIAMPVLVIAAALLGVICAGAQVAIYLSAAG
ncbi:hypothetical protein WSK_3806 [Novosphingobium sp. Rr 2-17]|uniref:hypothetical protein n=1 Tax=Novosphingobium sp. Rr 2-17 TaxID=555793 RepID=UPI00026988F6|nr:hypothetical protein [Novosphingobium sp. Rr 2-17]EIZ77795.1 hypothetical protein WSK_3806 [Novosphingobium sp. Rr 2-17]